VTPYQQALISANREAMRRDEAGHPLPPGQRRHLSLSESYAIAEHVRQGFGESKSDAGFRESAPTDPAQVVPGFIERIAAKVASRTGRLARLETDPARLSEMDTGAFADHVEAVAESTKAASAPLPPARIADGKALSEMSNPEFTAYSERLLGAPMRLEPARHHVPRVDEALDVDSLAAVSESARSAVAGGSTKPTEAEQEAAAVAILEAHRAALKAVGRGRSPSWR
jgi:hypothetical protein